MRIKVLLTALVLSATGADAASTEAGIEARRAWQAGVSQAVKSKLVTPHAVARAGRGLCTVIRFQIDREGRSDGAVVARPSGSADWDRAVLTAMRRADRLPPPPDALMDAPVKNVAVPVVFAGRDGLPPCR